MKNIQVVGLGALNMDYLYNVERILTDGEAVVKESSASPGGSAANTIYGLSKLGVKTGFVGVVGDDADGKILVQDLQSVGADTSRIKIKHGAKSGAVLCLTDRLGRRSLYVSPGANSLLTMADLDWDYVNQARVLHLSSFANAEQFRMSLELIDRLAPSVKLSFSPGALYASRKLKALAPILTRSHILFLNQREIAQLTRKAMVAGAETCLKLGCRVVVVTLGKGRRLELSTGTYQNAICYIRDAENGYAVESSNQPVPQVDATGAGDAFAAGFIFGLLNGKRLEECGRLGNIVAQFSIREIGARTGLPTLAQLTQHYQELYSEQL